MLTIDEVVKVCEEGVYLDFNKKPHPEGLKGMYDPSELLISIYLPEIESNNDMTMTLLHEFVHARDDLYYQNTYYITDIKDYEQDTEITAMKTYQQDPFVIKAIKELYRLDLNHQL
ncbi:hypothetical protein CMO90_03980 [Candidatus Woesearchaeota archaeon]|jgi:hypothetical protein|nr:hypothetical protein [Candidatus Woesearchaeota archaeon]|tara:strand:- start:18 stop:365 length:348 start_codon:yes stop_codon:yes gene_type:complete